MHRKLPHRAVWMLALVSAIFMSLVVRSAAGGPGGAAGEEGFRENIAPFLERHCVKCHGTDKQEGELDLHMLDADVSGGKDIDKWKAVAQRLALNEMPPQSEPRPDVKALIEVRNWIKEELAKAGESIAEVEERLLLPGQGNRVDHDALFSGVITSPAASPARLWRLSDAAEAHHSRCLEWPLVLIGNLGGKLKAGRYVEYPYWGLEGHKTTGNLYTTFLHAVGQRRDYFGVTDPLLKGLDLKGPLPELLE